MKSMHKVGLVVALLIGIAPALSAQDTGAAKVEKAVQTTQYAVVQVGKDISVVDTAALASMREKIAAENKAAMDAWSKAKDAATAAKTPFTEKQPTAKTVKIIAEHLATKEAADKVAKEAKANAAKPAVVAPKKVKTADEGAGTNKKK